MDQNGNLKEFIAIRQDVTGFVKAGRKVIQKEKEKKEMEKEHYRVMNKTKDEFLVVFTHELKTPLNAIINFSESASKRLQKIDTPKKESLIEMMRVIKENGNDMLETIINILDLSRLKSNKLEFKRERFTTLELIEGLLLKFDGLINEGEVEILMDKENLDQILIFDKTRVMQIISNLLSNAIKYSNKKVSIYGILENDQLQLVLEDNGPGIEKKDKIFELYEQEDDGDIKRASKGTGVGLHFVKLLCEGMNIDLSLEDSASLGGSKFTLTFNIGE
jgi:signal transduction histidine kinase